jgi:hypothetical protein
MVHFNFWRGYLLVISYTLIAMGIYIVFLKNTFLFLPINQAIDSVFWTNELISEGTKDFKTFIYTFSGVYVLLWGVNLFFIMKYAFKPGNKWAWVSVLTTVLIWFFIMFPFSIIYKVYLNAFTDLLYFVILILPLIFTRKHFYYETLSRPQ